MHISEQIIALLLVASGVAMAVRRIRLPYTIALVIAGLGMGMLDLGTDIHLSKELLFTIILPPLLYEAAFHIDFKKFRRDAFAVILLAVPGVVISVLVMAFILNTTFKEFMPGWGAKEGFVFAALICATDPISVIAMFKKLNLSRRLTMMVEGESLFNDGTAVVIFGILLSAASGTGHAAELSFVPALREFLIVVLGGVAVGVLMGLVMSFIVSQIDDHLIEITLTTVSCYGSYLVAERLHMSGVIAVVAVGMMSGNVAAKYGMSPTTKISVTDFWEYVAFVMNSIVFLLIGNEVSITALMEHWRAVLIAWLAVLVSRFVSVHMLLPAASLFGRAIPMSWANVFTWGGIRGSISMVLALSLPKDFPHRETILAMTFGVVILTLFLQGLTIQTLLKWLGIVGKVEEDRTKHERLLAIIRSRSAGLSGLRSMRDTRLVPPSVAEKLEREYSALIQEAEKDIIDLHVDSGRFVEEETLRARRRLLNIEKESIRGSFRRGLISDEIMRGLVMEIDLDLELMQQASAGDNGDEYYDNEEDADEGRIDENAD